MQTVVKDLLVNRIHNPLGHDISQSPRLNWIIESSVPAQELFTRVQVALDDQFAALLYDSGFRKDLDGISFSPDSVIPVIIKVTGKNVPFSVLLHRAFTTL